MVNEPGNGRSSAHHNCCTAGLLEKGGGEDERTSSLPLLIGGDSHMWALGNPVFSPLSSFRSVESFVVSSVLYEG